MSAAQRILERVSRAKSSGQGRWMAACPCCNSQRGRPLAIREADDGRALVHAFCGCSTEAVLGALGLTIQDLFPEGRRTDHAAPAQNRIPAREVLEAVSHEVYVAAILVADLAEGKSPSPEARERLNLAASRIGAARVYLTRS